MLEFLIVFKSREKIPQLACDFALDGQMIACSHSFPIEKDLEKVELPSLVNSLVSTQLF